MTIISSGIVSPVCLEVDYEATESVRRIYWADATLGKLESANLNGGERRVIKKMPNTKFHDMALFRVSRHCESTHLWRMDFPIFFIWMSPLSF